MIAVASTLVLGGVVGATVVASHADVPTIADRDVLTVTASDGGPGALYLVKDSTNATEGQGDTGTSPSPSATVTRVRAGERELPIAVHIGYSLDGPNVKRATVAGASGLVGVHVTLEAGMLGDDLPRAVRSQRMLVAFAVPTRVADDVNVNHDAVVTTQGANTVVAAVMRVGDRIDCYMNAKKFTMGDVVVVSAGGASALAGEAVAMGDGSLGGSDGDDAAGSGGVTGAAGAHQDLIDKLTALRDLERSLAASEIAAKQADYDKAFGAYMSAYVTSYTNHLSGSIGSSTQMTALMGTAGELSGGTPLAAAVLDEASATDALASAHQHTGAADAIEQVIRMVRAQGVDGLVDALRRRAGEETTEGAKAYAAGQSQLSQAMIPYSMAYTDAYTKHLSALTGGNSAGASAYVAEANAATAKEFGIGGAGASGGDGAEGDGAGGAHADDASKVDAAMAALAAARERTGAGSAYRQMLLRFAGELNGDATGTCATGATAVGAGAGSAETAGTAGTAGTTAVTGDAGTGAGTAGDAGRFVGSGMTGDSSLAARAETTRLRHLAAAERRVAKASAGDVTTTVIDETVGRTDSGEVLKFAGGVPGVSGSSGASAKSGDASGASGTNDTGKHGSSGAGDTGTHADAASSGSSESSDSALTQLSPYVGMSGSNGSAGGSGTRLTVDTTQRINDATALGDAGALIQTLLVDAALQAKLPVAAAGSSSTGSSAGDSTVTGSSAGDSADFGTASTRLLLVIPAF